jgi:hypothetical protein
MVITGTIQQGQLHLDQPVDLPDNCREQVTIEVLPAAQRSFMEAFEEFVRYANDHPIDSGGLRYTRDQLHERR